MKITPEQLKAVQEALPDNDVLFSGESHFDFMVGQEHHVTDSQTGAAIFCDLLKRAVLAIHKDDVQVVSLMVSCGKELNGSHDWRVSITLWSPNISSRFGAVSSANAPTELQAWVLAVTELAGRLGE